MTITIQKQKINLTQLNAKCSIILGQLQNNLQNLKENSPTSIILETLVNIIQITWNIKLLIQQTFFDHEFSLAPTFDFEYIVSPPIGSFQKFLIS